MNVSTRVDVRTWHNLTRCSYSQTCVDCHNRYKNHRSRDILLWQGQISCKCCSGFNILTLMTKVTVLPLRKHNVWSLSLTLLMNSVGVSSSLVTSVSRLTRINLFSLTGILLSKIYCAASSIEENSVPIEPALTLPIVIIFDVLLFKHQHLNASPYGFAGVYRQCRCVITVCTRKSPACHKVCNFNKIYCPFFRFNINKDNVHKSIIS